MRARAEGLELMRHMLGCAEHRRRSGAEDFMSFAHRTNCDLTPIGRPILGLISDHP